jgi:hypothetical protein
MQSARVLTINHNIASLSIRENVLILSHHRNSNCNESNYIFIFPDIIRLSAKQTGCSGRLDKGNRRGNYQNNRKTVQGF